jgi:hypothetical protein
MTPWVLALRLVSSSPTALTMLTSKPPLSALTVHQSSTPPVSTCLDTDGIGLC